MENIPLKCCSLEEDKRSSIVNIANLKERLQHTETSLHDSKNLLKAIDWPFHAVRDRYLENYREHVLKWFSDQGVINKENAVAHFGNALYDTLFVEATN